MQMSKLLGPLIFNLVILIILYISYRKSEDKTKAAIKEGISSAKSLLPIFILVLFVIAISGDFFSDQIIAKYITKLSGPAGLFGAAILGSIVHIPAFIAFPIGGQILKTGVNPGVIAVLINTLIMVHTFTIPLEIKELGLRFALVRNLLSFFSAIFIGVIIGVVY